MSRARRERRAAQRAAAVGVPHRDTSVAAFPRLGLWLLLLMAIAVAVAYWPVRQFGFVRFDDPTYVSENPHVLGGLSWSAVGWAFTSGYGANWHPITWMSHMLDVQLFGLDAGAHHSVNVVIHAANSMLLFLVLLQMTGAVWRSAFVAAAFALHPIHVESVAWVAERKDVLSTLFWTLSIWAYARYAVKPRRLTYVLLLAAFALALMAKPMVVTLPFALLLLDVWPLGRFGSERPSERAWPLVREKLPLFALSLASSCVTYLVQQHGGTVASGVRLPFAQRLANALVAYVAYLGKAIWPLKLAAYYPYPDSRSAGVVLGCGLLLAGASVAAALSIRRRPYIFVGWFWYMGTLVPAIGIVQVGTQAMADRYTYVPLVGIFMILAWGVPDLLRERPWSKVPIAVGACAALLGCAVAARLQVGYWESSMALWRHALAVTRDNYAAHTYYGNALSARGDLQGAIAEYSEAIRIRPSYPEAHNNLGPALAQTGRINDAIAEFHQAIRLRPNYADAHNNLGVALASQGKFDDAILEYAEALRLDPDHAKARTNLGLAFRALGRTADAVRELDQAVKLHPNDIEARNALDALVKSRR
jgi:Flp pilus assembly protein TadD